jgi:hypothetical protein
MNFEFADRRHVQHILGIIFIALCTLVCNANVGQAGIGTIHQAQVSNYCPVPPNAVITQPKMLFLLLDHHLNSPPFHISANNVLHRQTQIVRNQCNNSIFTPTFGEHDLHPAKVFNYSNTLGQFVAGSLTQSFNVVPPACSVQNIPSVATDFVFDRINCEPSIGLAYAYKRPFSLFARIDNRRTKIERIEQNSNLEFFRYDRIKNDLSGKFGKFLEWNPELFGMLFPNVQPRAEWYGNTPVIQRCFEDSVSHVVFSGGVVMYLSYSLHLPGPLDCLGVINDKQTVFASFLIKFFDQIDSLRLYESYFIKFASPEELAMVSSVFAASQQVNQPLDSSDMAETYRQGKAAIIVINVSRNLILDRLEKKFDFFRNFADSNHTASLRISFCLQNTYRQERLFLFNQRYHQNSFNRSV